MGGLLILKFQYVEFSNYAIITILPPPLKPRVERRKFLAGVDSNDTPKRVFIVHSPCTEKSIITWRELDFSNYADYTVYHMYNTEKKLFI